MRHLTTLASAGAALALMLGLPEIVGADKPGWAGKPSKDAPKTQTCTLFGDADGSGAVGIDGKSYGDLEITASGDLDLVFQAQDFSVGQAYPGLGRVLKKQGRMDFYFGIEEPDCRPAEYGEETGPGTGICRYRLILFDGVYDRRADTVAYDPARVQLWDNWCEDGHGQFGTASLIILFE